MNRLRIVAFLGLFWTWTVIFTLIATGYNHDNYTTILFGIGMFFTGGVIFSQGAGNKCT
jgi:hypothetical protein